MNYQKNWLDQPWIIASTFTADFCIKPLEYMLNAFGSKEQVTLLPYNQWIQNLLNPDSLFFKNLNGINLLLIRISDLVDPHAITEEVNLKEFVQLIHQFVKLSSSSLWVCFCPEDNECHSFEEKTAGLLAEIENVCLIRSQAIFNQGFLYSHFDNEADRIAQIPYSYEGFTVIVLTIIRLISSLYRQPYKVIVVDCDNTLWQGVCSEVGFENIQLNEISFFIQSFLVKQYQAGMLICLCSKNVENDVFSVFDNRQDMLLKREHITAYRINWKSKAENLQSLASLLNISLDSFIFIDDNPMECVAVTAAFPEVLTILLPNKNPDVTRLLNNIWAFDHYKITDVDRQRTQLYQRNFSRSLFSEKFQSLTDFIKNLNIEITYSFIDANNKARIAQLLLRTNQFNLTGFRWTELELSKLLEDNYQFYGIEVTDRFGDYGLVGVIVFYYIQDQMIIKNFILSCRVLGKGVEHQILAKFARQAMQLKIKSMIIEFYQTEKNLPAIEFLNSLPTFSKQGNIFECHVEDLVNLEYLPPNSQSFTQGLTERIRPISSLPRQIENNILLTIAEQWSELDYLVASIFLLNKKASIDGNLNRLQRTIAEIFANVLSVSKINLFDNFFNLGGNSLLLVQVLSRIYRIFSIRVRIHEFYKKPTISGLAELIGLRLSLQSTDAPVDRHDDFEFFNFEYDKPYPLYFSQLRLWFIEKLVPGNSTYIESLIFNIKGVLNINALEVAFTRLVEKHGVFRTSFHSIEGEPKQIVHEHANLDFKIIDLMNIESDEILKIIKCFSREAFDFRAAPLLRIKLLKLKSNNYILLILTHHLIVDGWSLGVIVQDIAQFYESYLSGREVKIESKSFNFVKYVFQQNNLYQSGAWESQKLFWQEYLKGLPILNFPSSDGLVDSNFIYSEKIFMINIDKASAKKLKEISMNLQVSLFSMLFCLLSLIVYHQSNQDDFSLGTVSAGRDNEDLENVVGMFVKTLLVRVKIDVNISFANFLEYMHKNIAQVLENQDFPYEYIIKNFLPRSHHNPIKVMLALQNQKSYILKLLDMDVKDYPKQGGIAKFDLMFEFDEIGNTFHGYIRYNARAYSQDKIQQISNLFIFLIKSVIRNSNVQIFELISTSNLQLSEA